MTACKHTVSGTVSLPSRGAFHLSLTVLVHYRSAGIFRLTGWSPWIHARFHVARATQVPAAPPSLSPTGLSPTLARLSSALRLDSRVAWCWSYNPGSRRSRFGLFPFRSPLLRESRFLSVPPGTEMFQFPGFPPHALWIHAWVHEVRSCGFPHSDIPGSKLASSSPRLIAGSHVLHRFGSQGIHRVPLVT
jgi:hypothetical protein